MDEPIKNSWDLRQEIIRLKGLEKVQGEAIAERFNSPAAIFSTVYSLFPKSSNSGENKSNIFNQDFVSILSRFLIPFTLNKTIFKHSGFLIKTLVGLVSQKASGYVNEESVVGIFDKVKALFTKKRTYAKEHYPYSL
ncbi:hypothetical protein HDF18_18830 [Mucilaginibacter sp. X5P1]|uniref:hypothetical protein n=1 Tax=Mucilaginibacter sp. X5P1 TaxID=2723088 RepID=UPI00160E3F84|nr:hypothetical protein [Mucilaginibacter sp. X5P1]MBB6139702.1 hypothetical protein [Mucilaginibacter sp. X5P1]